jgi:hypothetical protein
MRPGYMKKAPGVVFTVLSDGVMTVVVIQEASPDGTRSGASH